MLYHPSYKKPIPPNAKRRGKRATWGNSSGKKITETIRIDSHGVEYVLIPNRNWYARYTDSAGRRVQRSTQCTDRDAAMLVLNGWRKVTQQVRAGVVHPSREHTNKQTPTTVTEALSEYLEVLRRKGRSRKHVDYSKYVITMLTDAGIVRLIDLTRRICEQHIATLQDAGKSARTRNQHKALLSGFCMFCVRRGYLESNPASGIEAAAVALDRRYVRRAYTDDEVALLLDAAALRPLHDAQYKIVRPDAKPPKLKPETKEHLIMLGRERRLIYSVLVTSGIRWGELKAVRVADVVLGVNPHIRLKASGTKNRKADTVPLTVALAEELRDWLRDSGRIGQAHLFGMPENGSRIFNLDREFAGIEKETDEGIVDTHSLRHTCATRLARAGVPIATTQRILRHSDPKITMAIYSHLGVIDTTAAVESLPAFGKKKRTRKKQR